MTIDKAKLKALAEAAPTGPWYPPDEYSNKGMVFDCDLGSLLSYEGIDSERDACVAYVAAANPATVLALLAEIETLKRLSIDATNEAQDAKFDMDCMVEYFDKLKAEHEALRAVMAAVVSEIPHAKHIQPGNSPGHSHRVPGVWDEDNGAKAGKECGWCKVWKTALSMSKEDRHE